jgi:F420-0:gamma-glutamyl ligase
VMGQSGEGRPALRIRGLAWNGAPGPATDLVRPKQRDLFR